MRFKIKTLWDDLTYFTLPANRTVILNNQTFIHLTEGEVIEYSLFEMEEKFNLKFEGIVR